MIARLRRRVPQTRLVCLAMVLATADARAQEPAVRILVMPFEDARRAPRIYWLTEGAAVLIVEDLNALGASAITREERLRAFERLQVPSTGSLSQATMIRIGQLLGASRVVTGALNLEGEALEMRVRNIRLDTGQLDPEIVERGSLSDVAVTTERVARRLFPTATVPPEQVESAHPPPGAFENYIKGLIAETPASQEGYLEAALRIAPGFDQARLALWTLHDEEGAHALALAVVQAVSTGSRTYPRARFHASVSFIQLKRYDEAFAALRELLARSPDAAVLNNLGVVQVRRGSTPETGRATYYFNQAVQRSPDDPDYYFNLGYAYWLERDLQAAIYWLRECVRRSPADGDAHFVLGAALQAAGTSSEALRENELALRLSSRYADWERRQTASTEAVPRGLERLRSEPEFPGRRLDTVLVASEQREQREMATFHLERGRRFYDQENDRDAIDELRRAIYLSPYQAEAHLLLGRIYMRTGRLREAIDALKISTWSDDTAAAHLALGEALLQSKDEAGAQAEANRALVLEPDSSDAKALLERIASSHPR